MQNNHPTIFLSPSPSQYFYLHPLVIWIARLLPSLGIFSYPLPLGISSNALSRLFPCRSPPLSRHGGVADLAAVEWVRSADGLAKLLGDATPERAHDGAGGEAAWRRGRAGAQRSGGQSCLFFGSIRPRRSTAGRFPAGRWRRCPLDRRGGGGGAPPRLLGR